MIPMPPDKIEAGLKCTRSNELKKKKGYIVGGSSTEKGRYPWQIRLRIQGESNAYTCSGSILSDDWVITAAHCCENAANNNSIKIHIGDWEQYEDSNEEFSVSSLKIVMHPAYPGPNGIANDICMIRVPNLETNSPAACQGCYASICLPSQEIYMGEACHVSGWGFTIPGEHSVSPILKEAGVSIMSHNYCTTCSTKRNTVIEGLEFCAGSLDRNGDGLIDAGNNTCHGDSGGPVTCVRNGQPELAGLTSWGSFSCSKYDQTPSVFVNIRAYVKWIEKIAGWKNQNYFALETIGEVVWGVNAKNVIWSMSGSDLKWTKINGNLKQIEVGNMGVFGINKNDDIFYRVGSMENRFYSTGFSWQRLSGKLKQISVGSTSVWGVNAEDEIFEMQNISYDLEGKINFKWKRIPGALKYLSVYEGIIWGVNKLDMIYFKERSSSKWTKISGSLKQIEIGKFGVFGINNKNLIFYRVGTFGNPTATGSKWQRLPGNLKQISCGQRTCWGVNKIDYIWMMKNPVFDTNGEIQFQWKLIPGRLTNISNL